MREILFRGKTPEGGWVYGSLIHAGDYCCILEDEESVHPIDWPYLDNDLGTIDGKATPVIPETVGQFAGLLDKKDKKIFEGDIVKTKYGRLCEIIGFGSRMRIGWDLKPIETNDNLLCTKAPDTYDIWKRENLEVVGNIHDNPEMM